MFSAQYLSEEAKLEKLEELIQWLDELDLDDYFGTEGWKHMIGWED